jgi:ferredoxin--NADP+ reductase
MPYWITPQCSGNETICEDICPYECIETVAATGADSQRRLHIDAQFCVDCGACALACPENAIAYAGAYQPMTLVALGQAPWMRPLPKRPWRPGSGEKEVLASGGAPAR